MYNYVQRIIKCGFITLIKLHNMLFLLNWNCLITVYDTKIH